MSTDQNAQTPEQANQFAIADSIKVIETLKGQNQIPDVHRKWILENYKANNHAAHLYKNAQVKSGAVVQVDVNYAGKRGNGTTYELGIMLDVDVPPEGSTQKDHFGWEVKLDGQRKGNGHDWLPDDVLKIGRPAPGTPLETYPTAPEEKDFGGDGKVKQTGSFRRYKS